ncbi:MAG: radical SAM protein [Nanoarchaeota archaeon]|nr:radical SAM protein [Nanoarchaeota archaeon]
MMIMKELSKTRSLCPECLKTLDATIFEEDNKVFITKTCPEHGECTEVYWEDAEMYKKAQKWARDGKGISNPNIEMTKECPGSCGLCKNHKSHTCLGNVVITNRCDLACWYCFFFASKMGYVYEPTKDQIRAMLKNMRGEGPVGCKAVQFTGGNPEVREDLIDIIKIAKEEGYRHIQPNINGTYKLWKDPEFAKQMKEAGANTIYLSFDGTNPKTNPKNHWEVPFAIENCRKVKLGITLVPTVIKGTNDQDVGNIVKFGLNNIDIVRAINFQPVSLVGRISKADREKMRITIPTLIKNIEKQTDGMIVKEDWYPIPIVSGVTRIVEALFGKPQYQLSSHFACGMSTFVYKQGDEVIPFPRFVDVEGLMTYFNEKADQIESGQNRLLTGAKIAASLGKYIDKDKQPKDLNLSKIFADIILNKGSYASMRVLMHKIQMMGIMHFQDLYNYDIERTKRCVIHYAQPDGTIVPFCAFNVIPEWYRDKVQRKYSISIPEWEAKTGKKLDEILYKRDVKKLEADPIYKKAYQGFI